MPGGGVALLYASKVLAAHREAAANFDQKIGVDIVTNALRVPLKTIANNAGAVLAMPLFLRTPHMPSDSIFHLGLRLP